MRIIGCDLHARQQTISMLDTESGEVIEKTLAHEGETVREFYAALPKPVLVGLEATGSMFWFLRLLTQNGLQGLALSQGLRRGAKLWSQAGQQELNSLSLAGYSRTRREQLQ